MYIKHFTILNDADVKGELISDSIFDKYDFDKITANKYFELCRLEKENDEKIKPLIDLRVKDEEGHLYFYSVENLYLYLGFSSAPINSDTLGWAVREDFNEEKDVDLSSIKSIDKDD